MRLDAGARIGHYEVLSLIGAGGMGEVYKARDTRLGRMVAIKILHTPSADLRQRFEREARVVATLQHPHICTLIDIGNHAGADYIVMEFLDGKPLTCPQPLARLLEYGGQIADAVDAVHRHGVTHRDLKPDNILVTGHGVKILDFGIAKTVSQDSVTQTGLAIGTPGYMAPEQWRGSADHRTDIYAFGCLLYAMATGGMPSEKPLQPPRLEWIVRGCLAPEPDDRWQSIRDVGRLLKTVTEPETAAATARRGWFWPAVAALAALASAVAVWMLKPETARELLQTSLAPPPASYFVVARNSEGGVAVSPDGTMFAFAAPLDGRARLWVRRFDSLDAQMLPGTEGAFFPFWSPDSTWIAYYTPEKLMKVAVGGGAPQTICKTDPRVTGGSWGSSDVILMTTQRSELLRVPSGGGTPVPLFPGTWPHFLPDGQRFLFQRERAVWVGWLDGSEQARQLVEAVAMKPRFSRGHLLFIRNRVLMAQLFDPSTLLLSGTAFPVAESIAGTDPVANPGEFSAAVDGRMVYAARGDLNRLVWRDRAGKFQDELASGSEFGMPRISPDGRRVAFTRIDRDNMDIWIADLARKPPHMIHFTFDPAQDRFPIWSPDGAMITFASGQPQLFDLYRKRSDGTGGVQRLTNKPSAQHAMDWSADAKSLAFTRNTAGGTDLLILPEGGSEYTFLKTNVSEAHSQFSPRAARWIAYSSDDSGRREIYVKAFIPGQAAGDARTQISPISAGGTMPRWRSDGRELYLLGAGRDNHGSLGRPFGPSVPVLNACPAVSGAAPDAPDERHQLRRHRQRTALPHRRARRACPSAAPDLHHRLAGGRQAALEVIDQWRIASPSFGNCMKPTAS